jgi:transposase
MILWSSDSGEQMVKCTKSQVRQLKTALRWKLPASQRERIQMVLLRESGMTQPAIAAAMGVSLSTVNRAHMAYDGGGIKALKPKPIGGRQRENMTVAEEKALLARFAKAAGAGELLNVHDLKAAYEEAIGHSTSNSTIYNVLARHGWRKLMPRPFHPKRDLAAQNDFKKAAFHGLSGGRGGRRPDAVDGCGSCSPMKRVSAG